MLIVKNCTLFECIVNSALYDAITTQFQRTSCTTHKRQHLPLTFVHLYARNLCYGLPNLQCSRRIVGSATGAPKFFQCIRLSEYQVCNLKIWIYCFLKAVALFIFDVLKFVAIFNFRKCNLS